MKREIYTCDQCGKEIDRFEPDGLPFEVENMCCAGELIHFCSPECAIIYFAGYLDRKPGELKSEALKRFAETEDFGEITDDDLPF